MTPLERRLTVKLLRMAADKFGDHGCNDYDLVADAGFTPAESYELRKMITATGDYPEDPVSPDNHYTMDWLAMLTMAKKLETE